MLWLVLTLTISQAAPADEARGQSGLSRSDARLRLGFGIAGGGGIGGGASALGAGLTAEIGVVLVDRFSLALRIAALFQPMLKAVFGLDYSLSDNFSVGVAAGGLFISNLNASMNVVLPVRITFSPFSRESKALARKGLLLSLEGGPGYGFQTYRPRSLECVQNGCALANGFGFSGQLSVSYAWW